MSQEVYEMITRLDRERIETHLVVQCAPMISGMKVSNLLNVEKKLAPQMKQVLERSGISHYLLLESEDKATFLVYREDGLKAYLMQDRVCQSMKSFGYESLDLNDVLSCFQKRYADCMEQIAEFPHEMGLLLGYPVEDVEGFIENIQATPEEIKEKQEHLFKSLTSRKIRLSTHQSYTSILEAVLAYL